VGFPSTASRLETPSRHRDVTPWYQVSSAGNSRAIGILEQSSFRIATSETNLHTWQFKRRSHSLTANGRFSPGLCQDHRQSGSDPANRLISRILGKFPCIGRSRGEMALIPVPGNAPWFGGKPFVRNADQHPGQGARCYGKDGRVGLLTRLFSAFACALRIMKTRSPPSLHGSIDRPIYHIPFVCMSPIREWKSRCGSI
jgi:hypothetical protein